MRALSTKLTLWRIIQPICGVLGLIYSVCANYEGAFVNAFARSALVIGMIFSCAPAFAKCIGSISLDEMGQKEVVAIEAVVGEIDGEKSIFLRDLESGDDFSVYIVSSESETETEVSYKGQMDLGGYGKLNTLLTIPKSGVGKGTLTTERPDVSDTETFILTCTAE